MSTLISNIRFVAHYIVANLLAALEYRAAFFSQVAGMIINDAMWVTFWWIYFTRFNVLSGGWRVQDVMALWAIVAVAVGLCAGLFGNVLHLAEVISQGKLDYYLSLPKNVLLHVLVSRMDTTAWGDLVFGVGLFIFFLQPTPDRLLLFIYLSLCAAVLFLGFNILWQSLAFWLGNAEGLGSQMWFALVSFATYPAPLFQGFVKALLFTLLPAAFLSHLPVEMLRNPDAAILFAEAGVAVGALLVSIWVFYRGLRRYESGNLAIART
jgi:ABC-2 type transport system permease protein